MSSHLEVLREQAAMIAKAGRAANTESEYLVACETALRFVQSSALQAALSAAPGCAAPSPQQPAEPQPATINVNEIDSKLIDAEPQQDGGAWTRNEERWAQDTTPQPAARRVTEGVFVEPVIVPGSPHAHIVRFRVGQQRFDIGDALDTQEEAAAFAGMFKQALESFANGGA